MWAENDGKTFVVAQVKSLFFLQLLGLSESCSDSGAELLGLLMLITQDWTSSHLNLSCTLTSKVHVRCGSKSNFLSVLCFPVGTSH